MLKKIIGTAGTRILNAFFNLTVLLLITNRIGSDGLGAIGLILLDVSIIQLVFDLFAGSAVVYFSSRATTPQLLLPAYAWIILVLVFSAFLGVSLNLFLPGFFAIVVPGGYGFNILTLSLLNGLMLTHYNFLIGKNEIRKYNIIYTIQISSMLLSFLTGLFIFKNNSIDTYLSALYIGYAAGAILSFILLVRITKSWQFTGWKKVFGSVIRYGLITQVANILNIGNKRFSFYFVRYFSGLSPLGIYTAGIQLTEGLRLIGQSISLVQFSALSNTNDKKYAKELSIRLMKFSVLLTISALLVLIILPSSVYEWLFSKDFTGVKPVILALAPGVAALAANNIFSHYFSGLGNPKVNLWSNVVGLVITLLLAIILIPWLGIVGAALATSCSYLSSVVYQYVVFKKQTGTKASEWVPTIGDVSDLAKMFKKLISEKDNKLQ